MSHLWTRSILCEVIGMLELHRVCLSYGHFGIEVNEEGKIVNTAPMGHWSVGMRLKKFRKWAEKRGGHIEKV